VIGLVIGRRVNEMANEEGTMSGPWTNNGKTTGQEKLIDVRKGKREGNLVAMVVKPGTKSLRRREKRKANISGEVTMNLIRS